MLDEKTANRNTVDPAAAGQAGGMEMGSVKRMRWNVLDLLDLFGKDAATCHLFCDIDMSRVEEQREQLKSEGEHVTYTAFLLKAIAAAQKEHPASRTFYLTRFRTVTYEDIVAGVTVERQVDGEPIVFFGEIAAPNEKTLVQIASELRDYSTGEISQVRKLKEQHIFARLPWLLRQVILRIGKIFPPFRLICMKSTFGLSSLGALDVNAVCGPSVCTSVFGVGSVDDRPVVRDKQIVIRPVMTLALSFDQRVMDGGEAARFLRDVKMLLEDRQFETQQPSLEHSTC